MDQVVDVPVAVLVRFGIEKETVEAPQLQGTLLLVLLAGISGRCFLSPFLTVPLAEVTRQSWRLLDEFHSILRRGHVAQHLVRQLIHILHQLVDGFGRISDFSTLMG